MQNGKLKQTAVTLIVLGFLGIALAGLSLPAVPPRRRTRERRRARPGLPAPSWQGLGKGHARRRRPSSSTRAACCATPAPAPARDATRRGAQFRASNHYLWEGKLGAMNDFCGYPDINFGPAR